MLSPLSADCATADDTDVQSPVSPGQAAILGNDATQGIDIRAVQIIEMIGQRFPRVPDRTDQFAGDAVARGRAQEHRQLGALAERRAALVLLLQQRS